MTENTLTKIDNIFCFYIKKVSTAIMLVSTKRNTNFTIQPIALNFLSGAVKYRHSTDWMDLETHHELMWIKEFVSCC